MAEKKRNETEDTKVDAASADAEAVDEQVAEEPTAEVADASADAEAVEKPVTEKPTADVVQETVEDAPAAEAADEPAAEADAPAEEPVAAVEPTEVVVEADAPVEEPAVEADAPSEETAAKSDEARGEPEASTSTASPKAKRKRLPRALRPQKTRPKRVKAAERKPIVRLETPEHERGRRQERQGTVVSDAMEKTIVVRVDVVKAHPRYKKVVRRSVKFHVHDETSQAKVGDIVRIVETRPLSKTKRWRLAEVVEAAK